MQDKDIIYLKVRFYIMSLWLLFVLAPILTIDIPIYFGPDARFIGIMPLIKRNITAIIFLAMSGISFGMERLTEYEWKGVTNPPYTIDGISDGNYEYLSFLTTCIIPLVFIDFGEIRYIIVLGIMLVVMGAIFIKMDLYCGNPTIALFGYRLYRVTIKELDNVGEIVLITKCHLKSESVINWIKLEEKLWVAKETRK